MNRNSPGFTRLTLTAVGGCLALAAILLAPSGCAREGVGVQPAAMALSGKLTLAWDPVPGAASYNVYFSPAPGVTRLTGAKIENAANPITIRDLERGVVYYFVVTAVSASGAESGESAEISHTAE